MCLVLLLACSFLFASVSVAQPTTDARDYEGAYFIPDKANVVAFWAYMRHQTTAQKKNLTSNIAIFRSTLILKRGGWVIVPIDLLLPVVDADLRLYTDTSSAAAAARGPTSPKPTGPVATGSARNTGFADLQFLPSVTYHITENAENHTHTYIGANLYIYMPIGNYANRNLVNTGENRWAFKPQLALGQRFLKVVTLDLVGNVLFYTDNDNYLLRSPAPTIVTLKQKPTFNAELHLAVDLHKTMYVSASYYLSAFGKRTLYTAPEIEVAPAATVHTMRFSWGIHITAQTLLLLQLQQDLKAGGDESLSRYFGLRASHAL